MRIGKLLFTLISSIFFFFVFFPYIKIIPLLNVDIQPYALLISIIVFVLVSNKKLPYNIIILVLPFIFSLLIMFLGQIDINAIRSISNYMSLFFISSSVYYLLSARGARSEAYLNSLIEISIYLWFFVGFVQTFFINEFATVLLPRSMSIASAHGRGVLGLAPEPTFYGIVCIFFLLILMLMDHKKKNILGLLLVIQIVVFAKSSMAVLFLVLFLFYFLVFRMSVKNFLKVALVVALVAVLGTMYFNYYFSGSRLAKLSNLVMKNPLALVAIDPSANDRYYHIFFSLLGSVENYFMPHGYSEWSNYLDAAIPRYENVWGAINRTRIMSGYGSALFELGMIALLIPISITYTLFKLYKNDFKAFLVYSMFLNSILLTAIPLALPMIGFIIGYASYACKYSDKDHDLFTPEPGRKNAK